MRRFRVPQRLVWHLVIASSIALASGPAGSTLGGTKTVRAVNGVAVRYGQPLRAQAIDDQYQQRRVGIQLLSKTALPIRLAFPAASLEPEAAILLDLVGDVVRELVRNGVAPLNPKRLRWIRSPAESRELKDGRRAACDGALAEALRRVGRTQEAIGIVEKAE